MADSERILEVNDLKTYFNTEDGVVKAVDGVSFHVNKGETVALVGESGSGKSVTSLSIMKLVTGRIVSGSIIMDGEDLLKKSERQMCKIRGNDISMIFQEPMTSLNPVFTIGEQITEALMLHQKKNHSEGMKKSIEMLELVGIPEPAKRVHEYPHQLSGGMRQRVMIAMALSCNPKLLIADEPTTALDVTIQAQIIDLMNKLQKEIGMAILFITHDLGVVAEVADQVVVMYAGRAVESADVVSLYKKPRMPYTLGLLNSIPRVDKAAVEQSRLVPIPGNVPNPLFLKTRCAFYPRCRYREDDCAKAIPPLVDIGDNHMVRCFKWEKVDSNKVNL